MTEVLDVYEMTPLQAGMLFHTLYAPDTGVYFEQCWCLLEGPLDITAFREAWQFVIKRHDVLRSECHWVELDRPVQVIYDDADPVWQIADWSDIDAGAQDEAFANLLLADRRQGFKLDRAPLLRFALLRLAPDRHRFVWSFHHLLMDGWCGSLLVREVLRHYGGADLPPSPTPYRRYIEWRAEQDEATAETYWRKTLAGLAGPTPLGIDRPDADGGGIFEIRDTLDAELSDALRELARTERLTLNTVFQGAWALQLTRYSGQNGIVFGAVLSGRPSELPGVEHMVGLFLNTVPVRVNTAPHHRLRPWLKALQTEQRERERFGYAALPDIQRWSKLPAGSPLFESLLIVENYPLSIEGAVALEDASLTLHEPDSYERTHYPLTLKVFPGEEIKLSLSIDTTRIEPAAAQRLIQHLQTLLRAFVERPDARLGEIELLDRGERDRILALGHGDETIQVPPIHEQILARATATPIATALEMESDDGLVRMNYSELAELSRALAAELQSRGVGPGSVIAVCLDRCPNLVLTLLGVLRTGAAYLPLDPDYPADRIAYVLADAGVSMMLTSADGPTAFDIPPDLELLSVADCLATGRELPLADVHANADDLAYILYTSGSTGRPKGVPIRHGSLSNFIHSMSVRPGLSASDRLLSVTTVAFDIAALELFGPLSQGGSVVLADAETARDGKRLAKLLERKAATVMQATPAGWRVLLEAGWEGLAGLKMLCGGEALDSSLAAALMEQGGELWNLYGPTETTIWSAALRVEPNLLAGSTVPVGGAVDQTQLCVLDQRGMPVPVGVPGELHIGGVGLSPGYWGKPALTAEKFIPNALGGTSGNARILYRTGDRVSVREDGNLEFLGRQDGQIKLRGYRIELGEIESRLASHSMVTQAVVVVRDDAAGPNLVAFLRWHDVEPSDPASILRTHLAATLPAYMMPGAYMSLAEFPLTPNGKVDRKAIADLGQLHLQSLRRGDVLPIVGEPAATLAEIWRQVLGVERVAPQDNFFELGGHSLLVVTVQSAIRQRLGVSLDIVDIFRFPTLQTLATHVTSLMQGDDTAVFTDRADARAKGQERLRKRFRRQRQEAAAGHG